MDDLDLIPKDTETCYKVVNRFIKRHKLYTGGCKTFYTPREWKYRKEEFGLESLLIVVYDGSDVKRLFIGDLANKFQKYLAEHGYRFENGLHWYSYITKL